MEEKEIIPDSQTEQAESKETGPGEGARLPADFTTFILSLSTSVLMHLGEIKNPVTDKFEKDYPMARHTIDIIGMMEEKTRGNLTPDEERLVTDALYDLRMRYLKAARGTHP